MEPELGEIPVAQHRLDRDIEDFRDLLRFQSAEEFHLDHRAFARMALGEALQSVVERDQIGRMLPGQFPGFIEVNLAPFSAPFFPIMLARVLNKNAAHQLRSHAAKMSAIPPSGSSLINEPEIGLVDQGGGLERVVGTFVSQVFSGAPA